MTFFSLHQFSSLFLEASRGNQTEVECLADKLSDVNIKNEAVHANTFRKMCAPTLPIELSALTQKDLEKAQMLKPSVASNMSPRSRRKPVREANTMTTRLSRGHACIGKHLTPIAVQRILPALWRSNEQAADIFPFPTTVFLR